MATRYGELPAAVAAGCERLVHPSIVGHDDRQGQRRFIGVMLSAPFLAAGAAVTLVTASLGAAVTIAAIFVTFGFCWFAALLVAASGKMTLGSGSALAAASACLAGLIAAAGGLSSPIAILVLALPVEAYWVGGSRRSAILGGLSALAALLLAPVAETILPVGPMDPAPWHWLLPLAWACTVIPRISGFRTATGAHDSTPESKFEEIMDAVVFRIASYGEVLDVSEKARSILKLAPELLTGTGLFDRVHLSDRVSYLSMLADMREGASLRKLDLRIRLPHVGSDAIVDNYRPFSLELMKAAEQENVLVAILRENDDIAGMRQALAAAKEAAASADVAKARFLAAVSHELRTPLNAIIGFSDMLLHEMFGAFQDPRQKEYVGLVRDSGQHLLAVVTSILDVSRIEAGAYTAQPEPFQFAEAVEMCRSMMQLQADTRGVRFTARVARDVGEINADRRAVQQILINLASNAIKFTPDGGEVDIGAAKVGSRLHFWVGDTGIGIAEKDLADLGKPFMQIQNDYTRRFEGTGLGLSLVKGLVALHDGTMSIESAPGEGTKVTITMPVEGPKERPDKSVVLPMAAAKTRGDHDGSLRKTA